MLLIIRSGLREMFTGMRLGPSNPKAKKAALPSSKLSKWHRRVEAAGLKGKC
jgi:hypothetical protein